jgi:UDP-glucose 4-epimerase
VKTLVTGGAGFVGLHLAHALVARGHTVHLADDFSRGRRDDELEELERSPSVRLLRLDLLDPDALGALDRDYEQVVHLAALVGVARVLDGPYRTLRGNVAMTQHVVDWAQRLPRLDRLLFASTSEIYAGTAATFGVPVPTPEAVPLTVADVADPRTAYAISKLYGESLCRHAGIPFTIVRPHNVYGPRMGLAHVIPELLERAHAAPAGGVLEVASIDHRRAFCFVEDAVELLARMLERPACEGQTLNVGGAEPDVSIGELAERVIATVGKPLSVRALPPTPGSPGRRCPDMRRTRALTGYEAQTGLDAGLERTYAWYRPRVFDGPGAAVR